MVFAIRLSCILAVVFCLASSGSAGTPRKDRLRLQQLQRLSEQSTNSNDQLRVANEVVRMYKRYRGRDASGTEEEANLNNKLSNFESKVVLVDGVPAQGGSFWNTIMGAGSELPDEVKNSAKALAKILTNYLMNLLMQSIGGGIGGGK